MADMLKRRFEQVLQSLNLGDTTMENALRDCVDICKDEKKGSGLVLGIDYWQVISHYPNYFRKLAYNHLATQGAVHVISAVGKKRVGEPTEAVGKASIPNSGIHEVVFDNPVQSPELKLAKCKELGVDVFYDDRDDVCRLLNQHGILAMRVTRKDNSTYDLDGDMT